ncbi:hypothetical protein [uncultured Desulfovibrio sp.]|uniref:hypothetical protein n=1 Tax=uncultured Desulfovibrio sp. TaxID=167968 RepID=UPI00261B3134|nr:hypothetical protein [uncultured Desulfovibrio sp.]
MKSGKCSVGRVSGQPRPMSGKTTLFPRNESGEQIENLHFQSRNATGQMSSSCAGIIFVRLNAWKAVPEAEGFKIFNGTPGRA